MCGVSVRTIQLDIKALNHLLGTYGIKIISAVKQGYCLEEKSKKVLKQENLIREVLDVQYINQTPNTPIERQMYLILNLIVKERIYFEELENKFYVSESTINKDIISAAKWLKDNLNIKMDYSLSKKVVLKVNEREKRNIVNWVLSSKLNASTLQKHWNYAFENNDLLNNLRKIYLITEYETKRYGYYLSGHSMQLLGIEIISAVNLNKLGFKLEENNNDDMLLKPVILAIAQKLKDELNIRLSNSEWQNIQEYFMAMQFLSETKVENIESEDAKEIVTKFLDVLRNKYQVELNGYHEVKENLILYVAPMINRIKIRHCIGNGIVENISHIHPFEYNIASEVVSIVKEKLDLVVPPIEVDYIAVYFAGIYKLWCRKLNAIIVCDYDECVISYIKNRIISQLEDRIKLSACYSFGQLIYSEKEVFKEVDLIITTSTVADKTNIPFVQISPVMDQKDLSKLIELIEDLSHK